MWYLEPVGKVPSGEVRVNLAIPSPANEAIDIMQYMVSVHSRLLTPNTLRQLAKLYCDFMANREYKSKVQLKRVPKEFCHFVSERGFPEFAGDSLTKTFLTYIALSMINQLYELNLRLWQDMLYVTGYVCWETAGITYENAIINSIVVGYLCDNKSPVKKLDYLDPRDMQGNLYLPVDRIIIDQSILNAIEVGRLAGKDPANKKKSQGKKKPDNGLDNDIV